MTPSEQAAYDAIQAENRRKLAQAMGGSPQRGLTPAPPSQESLFSPVGLLPRVMQSARPEGYLRRSPEIGRLLLDPVARQQFDAQQDRTNLIRTAAGPFAMSPGFDIATDPERIRLVASRAPRVVASMADGAKAFARPVAQTAGMLAEIAAPYMRPQGGAAAIPDAMRVASQMQFKPPTVTADGLASAAGMAGDLLAEIPAEMTVRLGQRSEDARLAGDLALAGGAPSRFSEAAGHYGASVGHDVMDAASLAGTAGLAAMAAKTAAPAALKGVFEPISRTLNSSQAVNASLPPMVLGAGLAAGGEAAAADGDGVGAGLGATALMGAIAGLIAKAGGSAAARTMGPGEADQVGQRNLERAARLIGVAKGGGMSADMAFDSAAQALGIRNEDEAAKAIADLRGVIWGMRDKGLKDPEIVQRIFGASSDQAAARLAEIRAFAGKTKKMVRDSAAPIDDPAYKARFESAFGDPPAPSAITRTFEPNEAQAVIQSQDLFAPINAIRSRESFALGNNAKMPVGVSAGDKAADILQAIAVTGQNSPAQVAKHLSAKATWATPGPDLNNAIDYRLKQMREVERLMDEGRSSTETAVILKVDEGLIDAHRAAIRAVKAGGGTSVKAPKIGSGYLRAVGQVMAREFPGKTFQQVASDEDLRQSLVAGVMKMDSSWQRRKIVETVSDMRDFGIEPAAAFPALPAAAPTLKQSQDEMLRSRIIARVPPEILANLKADLKYVLEEKRLTLAGLKDGRTKTENLKAIESIRRSLLQDYPEIPHAVNAFLESEIDRAHAEAVELAKAGKRPRGRPRKDAGLFSDVRSPPTPRTMGDVVGINSYDGLSQPQQREVLKVVREDAGDTDPARMADVLNELGFARFSADDVKMLRKIAPGLLLGGGLALAAGDADADTGVDGVDQTLMPLLAGAGVALGLKQGLRRMPAAPRTTLALGGGAMATQLVDDADGESNPKALGAGVLAAISGLAAGQAAQGLPRALAAPAAASALATAPMRTGILEAIPPRSATAIPSLPQAPAAMPNSAALGEPIFTIRGAAPKRRRPLSSVDNPYVFGADDPVILADKRAAESSYRRPPPIRDRLAASANPDLYGLGVGPSPEYIRTKMQEELGVVTMLGTLPHITVARALRRMSEQDPTAYAAYFDKLVRHNIRPEDAIQAMGPVGQDLPLPDSPLATWPAPPTRDPTLRYMMEQGRAGAPPPAMAASVDQLPAAAPPFAAVELLGPIAPVSAPVSETDLAAAFMALRKVSPPLAASVRFDPNTMAPDAAQLLGAIEQLRRQDPAKLAEFRRLSTSRSPVREAARAAQANPLLAPIEQVGLGPAMARTAAARETFRPDMQKVKIIAESDPRLKDVFVSNTVDFGKMLDVAAALKQMASDPELKADYARIWEEMRQKGIDLRRVLQSPNLPDPTPPGMDR